MATISLEGLVLASRRYGDDYRSMVSLQDLVLAWGRLSIPAMAAALRVKQDKRSYRWSFHPKSSWRLGLTLDPVMANSASMHMIPGSPEIDEALRQVRRGDIVRIIGQEGGLLLEERRLLMQDGAFLADRDAFGSPEQAC